MINQELQVQEFHLEDKVVKVWNQAEYLNFNFSYSYPVHTSANETVYGWVGYNFAKELLTVLINTNSISINYLSKEGHYYGKGELNGTVTLKKKPVGQEAFKCGISNNCDVTNKFGHFHKPAYKSATHTPQNLQYSCNTPNAPIIPINQQEEIPSENVGKTDITINILFGYSAEFLVLYRDATQLTLDNNELCLISSGIFSNNSHLYNVKVVNVFTTEVTDLQLGYICMLYPLDVIAELQKYVEGGFEQLNYYKNHYKANVVVLESILCEATSYIGYPYKTGFDFSQEAALFLGRGNATTKLIYQAFPTVLIHEIGHILGCSHPLKPDDLPNFGLCPGYGHEILNPNDSSVVECGTIMSEIKSPIFYFSNASIYEYPSPYQKRSCGIEDLSEAYKMVDSNLPKLAASV